MRMRREETLNKRKRRQGEGRQLKEKDRGAG